MSRRTIGPLQQYGRSGPTYALCRAALCRAAVAAVTTCVVLGGICSCASPEYVYRMYVGPARPEHELAIVHLNDAVRASIGERRVAREDYARAHLLPGTYPVDWVCMHGASVLVEPSGFISATASANVELQAGHVYSMHCARTYGRGYRTYQWMVDDTAGVIVAGERKP